MYSDERIAQLLKEISDIVPPENALMRGKNIVMAQVRQDDSRRLVIKEQSTRTPLLARALIIKRFKNMPIIALIVAIVLGGGGTVAASQNDLPGDALYKVKLASEAVAEATVAAGSTEAELNFKVKLAQRRAEEMNALKEKLAAVPDEQKQEVEAHIKEVAARLETKVEKMEEKIERLAQKDQPEAAQAAIRLAAYAEIMQGVIAGLEDIRGIEGVTTDFSDEFSSRAVGLEVALAKLKIKSEIAQEEVLKRHAAKTGLDNAAQGRVGAAENKQNAVEKMREQALRKLPRIEDEEMLAFAKAEFERRDAFYRDGAEKTAQARKELEQGNFEAAIKLAGEAFKLFTQFESPLSKDVERFKLKEEAEMFEAGLLQAKMLTAPFAAPFLEREGEVEIVTPDSFIPEPSVLTAPVPDEDSQEGMPEEKKSAVPSAEELKIALERAWEFYQTAASEQLRMANKGVSSSLEVEASLRAAKGLLLRAQALQAQEEIGAAKQAMRTAVELIEKAYDQLNAARPITADDTAPLPSALPPSKNTGAVAPAVEPVSIVPPASKKSTAEVEGRVDVDVGGRAKIRIESKTELESGAPVP